MNIFDIVGPIMIGPSSSHTAGVVRIGQICNKIFGKADKYEIIFYESFAKTYNGHGSDKAIIGGLLNMNPWDDNLPKALEIAKKKNMNYTMSTSTDKSEHPNAVLVKANNTSVLGFSVGGGNILIKKINDVNVEIDGKYDTIFINHIDEPGVIHEVTEVLYKYAINIANMKVYRSEKGGNAIMIIEIDGTINPNVTQELNSKCKINKSTIIPSI
ncbi:MAG: L-serine ammonia-lyase, iron-sulfur-dependent subunit beta [Lachnospirales bacterium]